MEGVAARLVRRMKERGKDVRMVDERRTSMLESREGNAWMFSPPKEIVEREQNDGTVKRYLKRVYGLKQCASTGNSRLWNRDKNAAINILQNYRSVCNTGQLPERFRRGFHLVKPKCLYYGYRNRAGGGVGFTRFMLRGWVEPLPPLPPLPPQQQ